MNKSEAKFHNTAIKMHQALFILLEEKDFAEITIMDLCNVAGIHRSTFYSHYDNTKELLEDAKDELIKNFTKKYKNKKDLKELSKEELIFTTDKELIPYLNFLKQNRKIFKIFMQNVSLFSGDTSYNTLFEEVFIPIYNKNNIHDKNVINYMAKYYLAGIHAIVYEWIRNDCKDSISQLCDIIRHCTNSNQ